MELSPETLQQYNAVREDMGYIDRSSVGKLAITGADRFSWLQGMVSNDVLQLERKGLYGYFCACVLDATGHILTDLSLVPVRAIQDVVPLAEALGLPNEPFLLADLPRANVAKIAEIFDRFLITEDVEIRDVSDALGCFAFQGPTACDEWEFGLHKELNPLADKYNDGYIWPADYTGTIGSTYTRGFNFYFPIGLKDEARQYIVKKNVLEIGEAAQEILRVEAGMPKYGVDMDETILAPEAGLMPTHISLKKGCYVGQEIIARIDSRGHTNRALTGLIVVEGDLPAHDDKIFPASTAEEPTPRETGWITSVVPYSPVIGRPIALGYVRHEHRTPGNRLRVERARSGCTVEVAELPFYRSPNDPRFRS